MPSSATLSMSLIGGIPDRPNPEGLAHTLHAGAAVAVWLRALLLPACSLRPGKHVYTVEFQGTETAKGAAKRVVVRMR
jgi:hypothetical protein